MDKQTKEQLIFANKSLLIQFALSFLEKAMYLSRVKISKPRFIEAIKSHARVPQKVYNVDKIMQSLFSSFSSQPSKPPHPESVHCHRVRLGLASSDSDDDAAACGARWNVTAHARPTNPAVRKPTCRINIDCASARFSCCAHITKERMEDGRVQG